MTTYITEALRRCALPISVSYMPVIKSPSTSTGKAGGYWLVEGAGTHIACYEPELALAWYRTLVAWYRQDIEDSEG